MTGVQTCALPIFPITPQLVTDVLWVPRIEFPDYPSCEHLRTMSRDELMLAFSERPTTWGERLYTMLTFC